MFDLRSVLAKEIRSERKETRSSQKDGSKK